MVAVAIMALFILAACQQAKTVGKAGDEPATSDRPYCVEQTTAGQAATVTPCRPDCPYKTSNCDYNCDPPDRCKSWCEPVEGVGNCYHCVASGMIMCGDPPSCKSLEACRCQEPIPCSYKIWTWWPLGYVDACESAVCGGKPGANSYSCTGQDKATCESSSVCVWGCPAH